MGRTLHYTLKKNSKVLITEADWDRIIQITQYFIKTYKWTCEEPGFEDLLDLQQSHGFTKVVENEFNALLVTAWLTAVSRILPKHEFTLHDEGKFLTKRIVIRAGQARSEPGRVWKDVGCFCRPVDPRDFLFENGQTPLFSRINRNYFSQVHQDDCNINMVKIIKRLSQKAP